MQKMNMLIRYLEMDLDAFETVRKQAAHMTQMNFSNNVFVRGLIEFSNYCKCSCHYCGLRKENQKLQRFRLEADTILACIEEGYRVGYRSFVLQSGEDLYYTKAYLGQIVKSAKEIGDIALTLSIGERTYDTYRYLKEQGVDRFLIKHECAEEEIYNALHPHSHFKNRLRCLMDLKQLGYQTGSGFMIGLPGQTTEVIAKDIALLQKIGVHMAGIGPFIAHPETVLSDVASGDPFMTLKAVALTRLVLPTCMLPVTTSLGVLDESMKTMCLDYGANVVMQKLEPSHLRKLYQLYPREITDNKSIEEEKEAIINWLEGCGKKAVFEKGHHTLFS